MVNWLGRIEWSKMPSIFWIIVIPLVIAAFIGGIIFFFTALSSVEGFASIIIFVVGFLAMRGTGSSIANALIILFFAAMGVAIDQTGNKLYNLPIEMAECPDGTSLTRDEIVTHPLPGRTDITQYFACVDDDNRLVKEVGLGTVIGIRFAEYLGLGYAIIWFHQTRRWLKKRRGGDDEDYTRITIEA